MASVPQLTAGSLAGILQGKAVERPVLQVLSMKKIQSENAAQERYRLQMSDGDKHQPCMLATQMNKIITSNEVDKYSVVMINRFVCNTIHQRKIIIIIDMCVLKSGKEVGGPIGHPSQLELVKVDLNAPSSHQSPMSSGHGNQGGGGGGYNASSGPGRTNTFNKPVPSSSSHTVNGGSYHNAAPPGRPGFDATRGGGPSTSTKMDGGGGILSQHNIFPISSLSPYQSKWTIRVRVASKPAIRTWSNSRGEGRVFNVDLVDESGEIRASGFNQVADKMHAMFEMGKVYYISRGRLKPANRQFNTTNNDYELSLNEDTEIELCTDATSDSSIPTIQYNFRPIADIEAVEPNTMIDVIGVCKDVAEITSIVTKTTNRKVNKRDMYLVDRSGRTVTCTLWGGDAEEFDGSQSPVVAVKGARVSDFGGRSLSTVMNSVLVVNPDIPEAHQLRGWFDSVGKNEAIQSISTQRGGGGGPIDTPYLIFSQVKELDLGCGEKPDYFCCKGSVAFARKENCIYKACPSPDCNKKVTEGSGGEYYCEKCNQNSPNFKYRMILTVNAADHSGSQWLTCFQETGSEILGMDAQQLGEMIINDEAAYDQVFQDVNFKDFTFKIRAKMDTFNDEQRLKCYCVNVTPVNYAQETRKRVENIKQLMGQ